MTRVSDLDQNKEGGFEMWEVLSSLFGKKPMKNKFVDAIDYGLRSIEESPFSDLRVMTQELSEAIRTKSLGAFGAWLEVDPMNPRLLRVFIGPETGDNIELATFTLSEGGIYPVDMRSQFKSLGLYYSQTYLAKHVGDMLTERNFALKLRDLFISHQIA